MAQPIARLKWLATEGRQRSSARFVRYWQQRELGLRVRRERGGYAAIEIDAFTKAIAANFARALKENLNGTRGLIIDLRGNGGGDAEAMTDIASSFLGLVPAWDSSDREGTSSRSPHTTGPCSHPRSCRRPGCL